MKIIIAGGREFHDYDLLCRAMDTIRKLRRFHDDEVEVVSGRARGADSLGERWANSHKLTIYLFPADWDKFKKSAGYRRNEEMAQFADAAVVFWDGHSRGSEHMINLARKHGLIVKIVKY